MATKSIFPVNPLERVQSLADDEFRRRTICGILESYNGNYDALSEAVQNSVDALEDAALQEGDKGPYNLIVTVNLKENWFSVMDTGIGMEPNEVAEALAPNVSLKHRRDMLKRRAKAPYRGYKGVGLTFLAYGTDDLLIHSKKGDVLTKGRMQYARAWADGRRPQPAQIVEDVDASPLAAQPRGTYIRVQFSEFTRPRHLSRLGSTKDFWQTVLRSRTAIGQVLLDSSPSAKMSVTLRLISAEDDVTAAVEPLFLFPHTIIRKPPFRFLDLVEYHKEHAEHATPPPAKLRQDGIYLVWDTERLKLQLTGDQQKEFEEELRTYKPSVYAFVPYQGSVWGEMNELVAAIKKREHLKAGLMIAVNRQRLADVFDLKATRFESFSRNVLVLVHFDNAKPDQGRKTLQEDVLRLSERAADRAVQYLAAQRGLLRPVGEAPTPEQREIEKSHEDWLFNVRKHAEQSPLHAPPLTYCSTPLTEQDVVGLFHQLSAVGTFPGILIYATSQIKTYDCLISFACQAEHPNLSYVDSAQNPFGISPYIKGAVETFTTKRLTLEFKNNLDALVDDMEGDGNKNFRSIDVAVCWSLVDTEFKGYALEEIGEHSLDERKFPGVTHLLRKDGEGHSIQVIMLKTIVDAIRAGRVTVLTERS